MGSKRWMLRNGLADLIQARVSQHERFVDLFCGSSAVSWHVASNYAVPVLASDLQEFCRVLAAAVVCRTGVLGQYWIDTWIERATGTARDHPMFVAASSLQDSCERKSIVEYTATARELCVGGDTPITSAYGGYYFSPLQAIYLDCLRSSIPRRSPHRIAALPLSSERLAPALRRLAILRNRLDQRYRRSLTCVMRGQRMWFNTCDATANFCRPLARKRKAWHCPVMQTPSPVGSVPATSCSSTLRTLQFITAGSIMSLRPSLAGDASKSLASGAIHLPS